MGMVLFAIMKKRFVMIKTVLLVAIMAFYAWLTYKKGYYTLNYRDYSSMLFWGVLFLMVALGICAYMVLFTQKDKSIKVLAFMVAIVILITPLGSNNSLYSPINNLYVVAPFVCSMVGDLLYGEKRVMIKGRLGFSTLPVAIVLGCVVCSVLIQSVLFGANFVFRDGTGGEKREYEVTNNEILANVKTTKENALNLQG